MKKKTVKGKDKKGKQKQSSKTDDGSAEIRRAEKRLASALADVDSARGMVARRERDLAAVMERYGRDEPAAIAVTEAPPIPLEAPSQPVSDNGTDRDDMETTETESTDTKLEQPAASDGSEQHG